MPCHFDRYDLVDLTRQVLTKLANQMYIDAMIAFQRKDAKALNLHSQKFVQLIKDIDVLLASDDNFLLGTWLKSAKKLAVNPNEMKQVRTHSSLVVENNKLMCHYLIGNIKFICVYAIIYELKSTCQAWGQLHNFFSLF